MIERELFICSGHGGGSNSGIGMVVNELALHKHDDVPIVHMEFQGIVRTQDTTLGKFFHTLAKTSEDFGQNVTMTVNGKPNTELMDYHMKDANIIVLNYD